MKQFSMKSNCLSNALQHCGHQNRDGAMNRKWNNNNLGGVKDKARYKKKEEIVTLLENNVLFMKPVCLTKCIIQQFIP